MLPSETVKLILILSLSSAGLVHAAEDGQLALKRIGMTVSEAVNRSDNYICAQNLSRFYYVSAASTACHQPPAVPAILPRVEDRLKLDVAVSQGAEIYSWHGEHKFSAASVGELVHEGPISSGTFSGYLRNIFGERGVAFIFRGRSSADGLELYHFDYDVPLASSHYELQAGTGFVTAPFHGSFSASVDTFELYSLTVTARGDQIPDKSNICAAETRLTYQMVKIGNHESPLPASFDLLVGTRGGMLTDSKGKFSECREYAGESTVHFDMDDASTQAAAIPELQTEPLGAGIVLQIALRGEIDEDSAYAGLPVEAVLMRNVKVNKGTLLARGAILHGNLTRFDIFQQPEHAVALKMEFTSITDGNRRYLCNAVPLVEQGFLPAYSGIGRRGRPLPPIQNGVQRYESDDGDLQFETRHLHLDKSFKSVFITLGQSNTDLK
jgi:hypothetical protein